MRCCASSRCGRCSVRRTKRRNKQRPEHPWMVAGERVKRERVRRIAAAIARMRSEAR